MTFAHPKMLWLLALTVPALALFLFWSWRKRQYLISQFVRSRLLAHLTVGLSRTIQKIRMVLLVVAVALLLLALAGPQWGFAWEEARQRGLDIVVAVDTSRSMLAEDIAPNRLERAKLACLDLMRLAKRDRLGLVAFAGTAFLQCPLTLDDEAFRQSVNQLQVGIIPQGGTALAEAIETVQTAFKEGENHRVLVLFTDGEDHDSGAVQAAEKAAQVGLRIYTVGVGTRNGELLPQRDEHGNMSFIKDEQGNPVKSRLDEALLTEIATKAGGFYLPMAGANTVDVLYQRGLAPLPKGEASTKLIKQYHDRYQWPLALAILVLVAEIFVPDRKRVQRTEVIVAAANPELRKMVAVLLLGLLAAPASGSTSGALRKYESGQYKDAYQEYSRLAKKNPDDVRLQYNAGAAAYQAKKFEEAAKHFAAAATAQDLKVQEHAYYNLGNSLYRLGEDEPVPDKKTQTWQQSVHEFEAALKLDPKDADAQFNLDYVKKKLEELKQQQQKQQDKKDQEDEKDEKDQRDQEKQDQQKSQEQKQKDKQQQQQQQQSSQQDKKDQDKKSGDQPQSQAKQNEEKKQEQAKQDKDKNQGQDNASAKPKPEPQDQNGNTNTMDAAASAVQGQMTPEQVKQLLDSQKNNEKMMIFIPPDKLNQSKRVFKDW
jgi:Ca-activated chloride channel family protein